MSASSDIEKERIEEDVTDMEQEGSLKEAATKKTTKDGILLIPQPSDDPEQPLVSSLLQFFDRHTDIHKRTGPGARSISHFLS